MPRARLLPFLVFVVCLVPAAASAQDRSFTAADGVRLRYVERGSGPAVVLIHGFTGQLEAPWIDNGLLADLAKDHRVVAFDLRGHGRSDKPRDAAAYADIGVAVIRLMDHLGIGRAHLVGYSLGGIIVLKLLTTHPQRIASAIIAGAAHRRSRGAEIDKAVEADALEMERGPLPYRSLILSTAPTDEPRPDGEALAAISAAIVARNDPLAHAALMRARSALVVRDEDLAAVRVPALALVGAADPALPRVERMAKRWRGVRLQVVPGATHPVRHPRSLAVHPAFAPTVRGFIAAASSGSAAASSTPPRPN